MINLLLRIHYSLLRYRLSSSSYKWALSALDRARKNSQYLQFAWLGRKPILNCSSVSKWTDAAPKCTESDNLLDVRILVHVAFHFDRSRLRYIKEVLRNISSYRVKECCIVVDTNSDATRFAFERFGIPGQVRVQAQLRHPFMLTWACREEFAKKIDEYDVFMYVEDDILVPFAAITRWHEELDRVRSAGFLPGFLRVELNRCGSLVSSDFFSPASCSDIVSLEGRRYLCPPYPYQAFWIYDRTTMREFVESESFWPRAPEQGNLQYIRERAALGLTFESSPLGSYSRHVIPLTSDGQVDSQAYVFHLPSNYGRRWTNQVGSLGALRVADLFKR
jgi:hypothetical protein